MQSDSTVNVYDFVGSEVADNSITLQKALSLLGSDEAARYYREKCTECGVKPNTTFLHALRGEVSLINFANSYFGERGMTAVAPTLQRIPVISLDMRNTSVGFDDIGLLSESLVNHPTLTSLDLRENHLSLPSARRLLSLVIQNKRITTLSVNEDTPKNVLIQRQCLSNGNVCVYVSSCVICQKSMIHSVVNNVEAHLILRVIERMGPQIDVLSPVEFETIWRCLIACADVNDGSLFLCSPECIQILSDDIVAAVYFVMGACFRGTKNLHPKNQVVSRCADDLVQRLQNENPPKSVYEPSVSATENPVEEDWKTCSLCGTQSVLLSHPHSVCIKVLAHDLNSKAVLRPSAFMRLIHMLLRHSRMAPCSKKCVRMLVRFGIHGVGGALRSRPSTRDQLLTSLAIPLDTLPATSFAVINLQATQVLDQGEEDTTCACSVASLVSDIDEVAIDPYYIFAQGRHLAQFGHDQIGLELRMACEAVKEFGCLPRSESPFEHFAPRANYATLSSWELLPNFPKLKKAAYGHRKLSYFAVCGPHDNLFDNTRAALWAHRTQHRAVVTVIKWRVEWLACEAGIIPSEQVSGGFYTAVKVVGQTTVGNTVRLILEPNFGSRIGNKGFFYVSRTTFNRNCKQGAFMFLDTQSIMESTGMDLPAMLFPTLLKPTVLKLVESAHHVFDLLTFLNSRRFRVASGTLIKSKQKVVEGFPPGLLFTFFASVFRTAPERLQVEYLSRLYGSQRKSQLAFYWNEVLSANTVEWMASRDAHLDAIYDDPVGSLAALDEFEGLQSPSLNVSSLLTDASVIFAVGDSSTTSPAVAAEETKVELEAEASKPKPPKQDKAKKAPPRSVAKQQEDAMIEKHQRLLALASGNLKQEHEEMKLRIEAKSQRQREENAHKAKLAHRATNFSWNDEVQQLVLKETAQLQATEEISYAILGKGWLCLNLPAEGLATTTKAIFFIQNLVCRFDCEDGSLLTSLCPMAKDPALSNFPFANGFDAATVCSAVSPTEALFFANGYWLSWDLVRNSLLGGPYNLHTHKRFRALPVNFRKRIDTVLDVVGKKQLLFFSKSQVQLYSWDDCAPIGDPFNFLESEGPLKTLSAEVGGPMAQLRCWELDKFASMSGYSYIFGARGNALWFDLSNCTSAFSPDRITSTPFSRLSVAFLQQTTLAVAPIQKALKAQLPRNKLCNAVQYVVEEGPKVHGVAPSVLEEGITVDWKLKIHSNLPRAVSSLDELVAPISRENERPLLTNLVLLRQGRVPIEFPFIEFDFGRTNTTTFGYLQVFLDLSYLERDYLHLQPAKLAVETSWDGIGYREVGKASVVSPFCHIHWPATHSARFWRIVFENLPADVGIVRTFWFKVHWVHDSNPYKLWQPFTASESSTCISVEAASVTRHPSFLLAEIASGTVFTTNPQPGLWTPKQTIIPLPLPSRSALFFCGDSFVEWNLDENCVVGSRVVSLAAHPCFAALPFPFSTGIDAACYPDPGYSKNVLLICNQYVIEWNFASGTAVGKMNEISQCFWFRGLPEQYWSGFDAVLNVWEDPGHVYIFKGLGIVRWDIHNRRLVEETESRDSHPLLNPTPFAEQNLTTVVSFPTDPCNVHFFCAKNYCSITSTRDHQIRQTSKEVDIRCCPKFSKLLRFLPWGAPRKNTQVIFDFGTECPMLIGVSIRSTDGFNPETSWEVECSADADEWKFVCQHYQNKAVSSTVWASDVVDNIGHRYWRLRTSLIRASKVVEYSSIHFLQMPKIPYTIAPVASNCVSGRADTAFLKPKGKLKFKNIPAKGNPSGPVGELVLDYGETAPPELTALSFDVVEERRVSDLWTILWSDDSRQWNDVGTWRVRSKTVTLEWAPCFPHRYWKIQLEASNSIPIASFSNFCFHEYAGPSCVTSDPRDYLPGIAALCPSFRPKPKLNLLCRIGEQLLYDFKGSPQTIVGLGIYTEVDSLTFSTAFDVEYSDDVQQWHKVDSLVVCDDLGTTAWESEGPHRFWRLKVSQHYGGEFLRITRIEFHICGPTLYRRHHRLQVTSQGEYSEIIPQQQEFVAVDVRIPGNTTWAVERSGSFPLEWECVAVIHNSKSDTSTTSCGWAPCGSSLKWRIRQILLSEEDHFLREDDIVNENGKQQLLLAQQVVWFSFSGERVFQACINGHCTVSAQDCELTHAFYSWDEINNLSRVGDPCIKTARADSTITWVFDRTVVFCEVEIYRFLGPKEKYNTVEAYVETSHDGQKYSPIALMQISSADPRNTAFWTAHHPTKYLRLRFVGVSVANQLLLDHVTWMFKHGIPTLELNKGLMSNCSNFAAKLREEGEYDFSELLIPNLKAACSTATSFQSGFVEESELQDLDMACVGLIRHQKAVQKGVSRFLKDQKGKSQFVDVVKLLGTLSLSAGNLMNTFVNGSITFSELKMSKEASTWFFPRIEYRGNLVQPLFGFVGTPVNLVFRWFLDAPQLRRVTELSSLLPLGNEISVTTIVMNVTQPGWMPAVNFPHIAPLLYELGVVGTPFVCVLSTGRLDFGASNPLIPPGTSEPAGGGFPLTIHKGCNLLAKIKVSDSPSNAFELLSFLLPKSTMSQLSVYAVIHTPTLSEASAFVRFSVDLGECSFGIPLLCVRTILIELMWTPERCNVSFLSTDATFDINGKKSKMIISGQMSTVSPLLQLRGVCPSESWKNPQGLEGTIIENIVLFAEALLIEKKIVPSTIFVEGMLCAGSLALPCKLALETERDQDPSFSVELMHLSFGMAVGLCSLITRSPLPQEEWMNEIELTITCSLQLQPSARCATGVGSVTFFGQSGVGTISATDQGLKVSTQLIEVSLGHITIRGSEATGGSVSVDAKSELGIVPNVRINGIAALITSSPTVCQLELSSRGILCLTSSDLFDALTHDESWYPVNTFAEIQIAASTFDEPIKRHIQSSPIVASLESADVPFLFKLKSVSVEDCAVEKKTLLITFRGVLQGTGFEVMVVSCSPDSTPNMIEFIALQASEAIIEQCSEALWSAYNAFVGVNSEVNEGADTQSVVPQDSTKDSGTFLSSWSALEAKAIDNLMKDAVDPI